LDGVRKLGEQGTPLRWIATQINNTTFKHSHHQGVVNVLFTGLKVWVIWPPGVNGHRAFTSGNEVAAKPRRRGRKRKPL
jgi:hypothetical protein